MNKWYVLLIGILCGCSAPAGPSPAAESLYRDDFSVSRGRFEFHGANVWKIGGGQCRFAAPGHECFAVVNLDDLREVRIESKLTVDRRLGPGWVTAGLTLFGDPENHWRLLLVAGPGEQRYFEFVERHLGVHQAQHAAPPARTRLEGKREGGLAAWEYGRVYRLVLSATPKSITGEVRAEGDKDFWRCTYTFGGGEAVRSGRPGFTAGSVAGSLRDFTVEGSVPAAPDVLQVPAGPLGSAVIVPDATNRLAPVLERLLANQGFGTKILPWDELAQWRLSGGRLDLLVLADARRVPAAVARSAVSFLKSRGKLIAVGAPAFGDLLWKTPQGYVSVDRYAEAMYDALAKRPMPLAAAGWQRGAMKPTRSAAIALEPANPSEKGRTGPGPAWKISTDFEGWDNFIHPLEHGLGGGHPLLCFQAKGDAKTPQLAIECNEKDGSRWIATVELSPQWRKYVLWPSDFPSWHDSPAKRGGPGDRFNPAAAVSIHVGLSVSHTPRCTPGPHTLWIADLATAPDANVEQPEVQLPELEGLYPSYKLYPLEEIAALRPAHPLVVGRVSNPSAEIRTDWKSVLPASPGYAPVWRETGTGFDRGRPWRWIRLVEARDSAGRNRGAFVSLMLGQSVFPGGMWLNVGVADPAALAEGKPSAALLPVVARAARAMAGGCFLLEGGSRWFSYRPGERVELGAWVMNAGRTERKMVAEITVSDANGKPNRFEKSIPVTVPPDERRQVLLEWTPADSSLFPCLVSTTLREEPSGEQLDRISHTIDLLPSAPAKPEEFVKVEGSRFTLGGRPWYMLGVNYRPTSQGGRATLDMFRRDVYDPEIIERDLTWMESAGINMLSAIQAPVPEDPQAPGAYRDLLDFLDRCRRHHMKVFYCLHAANPLAGGSFAAVKKHIDAAGIKDHPAILSWELAWEPIYYSGPAGGQMDFLIPDWNAWIVERCGSVASAERDWGVKLPRITATGRPGETKRLSQNGDGQPQTSEVSKTSEVFGIAPETQEERVALPDPEWCSKHGPWDRATAAFRRFFSDHVGHAYGRIIRELRRYDPNHLITFRFGACGIPNQAWFAHSHSAGVAKHVDFLCPEGYNLQTGGWAKATPADDLRKGGLVTLYYRFLSREKPVVWMEFGYTVNGFQTRWKTGMERIAPAELAIQRTEYENFYNMFLESGARGAAPWWLPGGFRLDERSDFGLLEPDGAERPACQVLRKQLPAFAKVGDASCVAPAVADRDQGRPVITLDLEAHYADAWQFYSPQYLQHVKAGRLPYLRTAGTGTTSADCPLVAVGNTPLNGHNPPQFLNAEFNRIELKGDETTPWREASPSGITVKKGAALRCRASAGNTAEAAWLAPEKDASDTEGRVFLRCTVQPSGKTLDVPIPRKTPYLGDTDLGEFPVPLSDENEQIVTLRMFTTRRQRDGSIMTISFGQRRTIRASSQ
jgi:hypothetical protein